MTVRKVQHPFMVRTLNKLGMQGRLLHTTEPPEARLTSCLALSEAWNSDSRSQSNQARGRNKGHRNWLMDGLSKVAGVRVEMHSSVVLLHTNRPSPENHPGKQSHLQ